MRRSLVPTMLLAALASSTFAGEVVVLVSANAEWKALRALRPEARAVPTPFGEWFRGDVKLEAGKRPTIFFHGGWGKIDASASTQYAIDRWKPELLINIGTCGGFRGAIGVGDVILAEETLVYDIVEQMGALTWRAPTTRRC